MIQIIPVPLPLPVLMPSPPGVPDWVKILITALSSLSVGILLEPFRALIQNGIAKRRTLGFVADEINSLALSMTLFLDLRRQNYNPANPLTAKPNFDTERYDYAFEKDRSVLYQIPSWGSLKRFYYEVKKANQASALTDDEVRRLHMEFALLADRIKDGLLSLRMKHVLIDSKFSNLSRLAMEYAPPAQNRP